jgi:hypothetical protein
MRTKPPSQPMFDACSCGRHLFIGKAYNIHAAPAAAVVLRSEPSVGKIIKFITITPWQTREMIVV